MKRKPTFCISESPNQASVSGTKTTIGTYAPTSASGRKKAATGGKLPM